MSTARIDAVDCGLRRRLSIRPTDPHYDKTAKGLSGRIAVLVDGVELDECCSYDVDKGEVVRRYRNQQGAFVLDEQGVPKVVTDKGQVEVHWSKESAA